MIAEGIKYANGFGFNFPYWNLKNPHTWVEKYELVCTDCALGIEEDLDAEPAVFAIDSNDNYQLDIKKESDICDYLFWIYDKKEYVSAFDSSIKCSICGKYLKKEDYIKSKTIIQQNLFQTN